MSFVTTTNLFSYLNNPKMSILCISKISNGPIPTQLLFYWVVSYYVEVFTLYPLITTKCVQYRFHVRFLRSRNRAVWLRHNRYYRPQRSWAKVIFSQACVKNSVHGGGVSASVHAGIPHGSRHTPPDQTPSPPDQTPPREQTPPRADSAIRSTSGRYASYWNAFLFHK